MPKILAGMLLASASASTSVALSSGSPHDQAVSTCASLNMTTKLGMMHGFGKIDGYSRNSGCGGVCGRETFRWDNGPQGFGDGTLPGTATQWPSTLNMASTFDPDLALEWGTAMGEEFWGKGTNIQEGPGINVARIMHNGRNFEYISGEDPVLGSTMVVPVVQGIQKNVMAISKHYILNNQETHRSGVNELVDEATLMELYGPPFAAAVQESAGVMCAYNRINGVYACENELTMMTMLKGRYNFSGFVVSDWGATHSTNGSLQNGLDIEMPSDNYYSPDQIQAAIAAGVVDESRVEDSCIRALTGWFALPEDRRYPCRTSPGSSICINNNVSTADHKALARRISAMSTVLLKNDGDILPLNSKPSSPTKILLVGPDATQGCYTGGQGSGSVSAASQVCPLEAFGALAAASGPAPNATVCAAGDRVQGKIIGSGFFAAHAASSADACCASCAGNAECRAFTFESGANQCYLKNNDDEGVERAGAVSGKVSPDSQYLLDIEYEEGKTTDAAVAAAKNADIVIIFGSAHSGEGHDRANLSLGGNIDDLIEPVAAAAPPNKTIVVVTAPGSLLTPWRDSVAAILSNGLPGEQVGPALGDIIFGAVAPQGRLPVTFPNVENEQNMTVEQYPGVPTAEWDLQCNYSEGLINGYRWYDKNNVRPAFPFGHGLSYGGAFTYGDLAVKDRTVSFTVGREASSVAGCETAQVYFGFPDAATNPAVPKKVLRYFEKVCTDGKTPQFSQTVEFTFDDAAVSNWNTAARAWKVTSGTYTVYVGSSSGDIRATTTFTI